MSAIEVHLYDSANATHLAVLDTAYGVKYGDVLSGLGSGEFSIPLGSAFTATDGAILVAEGVYLGISTSDVLLASTVAVTDKASLITGGQIARLRIDNADVGAFVIERLDTPDVLEQRVLRCSGRTLLGLFERGIVYPSDTADYSTVEKPYLTKTFGYIVLDLAAAAAARGVTLPADDFSSTLDSDGAAWTDSNTVQYRAGTSLLEVILQHAGLGIEVTMSPAGVLHYYKAGNAGQNRASTVRFREGLNVTGAGRSVSYADIANAVLGQGQYILSPQTDATSIAAYGRRERLAQHGNISDPTTLATLTQKSRDEWKDPLTSIQVTVTDDLTPFVSYGLGDTVTVILPSDGLSTTYRIRGISLASDGGNTTVELTLNSLTNEYLLQLDQALKRKLLSPITAIVSENSDPNIGGWNLSTTQLSAASGAAILHSTGYLQLGTGSDIVRLDSQDATYRLWVGAASAASATFRVSKAGVLTATGATISGAVTATSGTIGGWTINSTYLAKDTGTAATSSGMAPTDYPFYAGATYANRATAPFRVTPAGVVTATSATITGTVTATAGAIGGWTLAATTLTGGDAVLASTGNLTLGTANDVVRLSADDATYRLWIGNATASSAPFRITKGGYVTAISGAIGGFTLSSTALYNGNFKLDAANSRIYMGASSYMYWTGSHIGFNDNVVFQVDAILLSGLDMSGGSGNISMAAGSDIYCYDIHHQTGGTLGFYGTTPVSKRTGCAVPTDLASCITAITALRTALNGYGLTTVV